MSAINDSFSNQKQELLKLLLKKKGIVLSSESIKRRTQSTPEPLSFAQRRLWFLNQLEGGKATYNLPFAVLLTGNLNVAVLEQAIAEILRRHEVLRTRFPVVNDTPVQVIDPEINVTIKVVDLQGLPEAEQLTTVKGLVTTEAEKPFDLANGPLVRSHLWRLNSQSHVLLINMHHIVSDGWSMGIFTQELSALYKAFLSGATNPLPELPIGYADFAVWQQQWLTGEVLEKQLDYWLQKLAGATPLLELPTDKPRPPFQSFRGGVWEFQLNSDLSQNLKSLSQKSGATLFQTLLAGFAILLFRYSGQDDICIGSPVANRNRRELEPLIGFFVNTLVLRIQLTGNLSFGELMNLVKQVAADAQAHQDVPFEQVVEALHPERNLSHSPLFQVLFDMQHSSLKLEMPGLAIAPLPIEYMSSKFDLSLLIEETQEGLIGWWEYSSDLFEADTIARMTGHFQTLLAAIAANPDRPINELPLLTDREQQLLKTWNCTHTNYPNDKCIHQLFEEQVQLNPDAIALVESDQQLTYQQLNAKANQLAHYLQSKGVGPEVLVGICMERCAKSATASLPPLMVVGLLAILKAGGAYVPLDPNYPSDRLAYMLDDSKVSVLLTQQKLVESLPEHGAKVIVLDADSEAFGSSQENPVSTVKPENLAYVIYTSGSTGLPKGVMIPHQGLVNHSRAIIEEYSLTCNDRVLQFASISFDVASEEIFPIWLSGGTLVMRPAQMFSSLADFSQFIELENLTVLNLPTPYWQEWVLELSHRKTTVPNSVRLVVTGSDRVLPERLDLWKELVGDRVMWVNAYGATEATITTTVYKPAIGSKLEKGNSVPIGRPIANTQIYILDPHRQPVPIGVPGELHIGGVGLAIGYLNRSNLTALKFIQNHFQRSERLYKTGDKARYLPDGNIEFLGRIDNQVKIRGFRIELGEIESLLAQHPEVRTSAVVAREDQPGNKQLVAYVVSNNQSNIQNQLRSFLKQKLPDYMIPSFFVMLEELPLTPSSKVDHRALPAPSLSNESDSFVPHSSPTEKIVASIWSDVLGLKQVGIHDNFFEVGGHSLRATQVMSRLRETFQVDLPLRSLFEEPTVAGLAAAIDTIIQTGTSGRIATNTEEDFQADAVLDPTILPQTVPFEYVSEPKSIFLTGANGFLGAYLLHELLEQTEANIYCLIRSANVEQAMQKLQSKLEFYGVWNETKRSRIILVVGDLSKNLLGLSPSQFRRLAAQIDVIYHNGAWINTIYPYKILKPTNVLGTQEILRLASEIKVKPVHHISTTSIFSSDAYSEAKLVRESDPLESSLGLGGGYSQSKWVAEKLVMQARDRGVPVSIYRLARITGHSQIGICNTDDLFCRIIKVCMQLGMAPNLDWEDNITPVDYVSRAIVHLSRQKKSLGKAFHLLNPHPTVMNDQFNLIRSLGYPLKQVSFEEWRSQLTSYSEKSSENNLLLMSAFFAQMKPDQKQQPEFDYQNTIDGLAGTDIICPIVDQKLLGTYFSYFISSNFLDENPLTGQAGACK